ncbi:MAG: PH domain-containing protein [Anaerolineaceae bacterium]|nr:PH domain-containing protein [Anaerolineaceae bacterium]
MANEQQVFQPTRRRGLILQAGFVLFIGSAATGAIAGAISVGAGTGFVLLLLVFLILIAMLPVFIYRFMALQSAQYILERDGLRIHWGLRLEHIPLTEIEWIRSVNETGFNLRKPPFAFPGSILGKLNHPDLGNVEFLASDDENWIMIATQSKILIISPENKNQFLVAFQRMMEMGSLTPIQSESRMPIAFVEEVFRSRAARILLISGFFLAIMGFVSTALFIPTAPLIPLGYNNLGQPLEAVPAEQLFFLPIVTSLIFAFNMLLGFYFYRKEEFRILSHMLWITSNLVSFLFILATILLGQTTL